MSARARIQVILDNTASREGLVVEHGLSLWIESGDSRILFDTGQGDAFARNSVRLGVPLERAEALVLSHGHYDHAGGVPIAMDLASRSRLFIHPGATRARWSRRDPPPHKSIGIPPVVLARIEEAEGRIEWTRGPTPVAEGAFVTGSIPRDTEYEDSGGPFFLDPRCRVPDPVDDDQALWLDTPRGIVAVLGCAHAGLVNTLEEIARQARVSRIHAVVGGLHLLNAGEERLSKTVEAIRRFGVEMLVPCHCTGAQATLLFERELPEILRSGGSGAELLWK